MKLIFVFFLLVVTILQYAQADDDSPEIPSMSLPTAETPSTSLPPPPTMYDSVLNNAQYYTSTAYNGISEYITIPYSYITRLFVSSSVPSVKPEVDTSIVT